MPTSWTSKTRHRFRRYPAQPYDACIFRLCSDTYLSLWIVHGRLTIPYQCSERQHTFALSNVAYLLQEDYEAVKHIMATYLMR